MRSAQKIRRSISLPGFTSTNRLTATELSFSVAPVNVMTKTVVNNFIPTAALGHVAIRPRGRRMSWSVAGKHDRTGKQKGPN